MRTVPSVLGAMVVLGVLPECVGAQGSFGVAVGLGLSAATVRSEAPDTSQKLTGTLLGGMVSLDWWRLSLDALYLDGSTSQDGGGEARDIVEGELMLGVRVLPWLALKGGPHIRSYILEGEGTQRWMFWELRLAAETELGTPVLVGYFEGWSAFSSDIDVAETLDRAQGVEGGLRFHPRGLPIWGALGYRMDHSRLNDGTRRETVEQLMLGVGVRLGHHEH